MNLSGQGLRKMPYLLRNESRFPFHQRSDEFPVGWCRWIVNDQTEVGPGVDGKRGILQTNRSNLGMDYAPRRSDFLRRSTAGGDHGFITILIDMAREKACQPTWARV